MIAFAWSGLPQYAAKCIGAFVVSKHRTCCVIATRPNVPIMGMEEAVRCPITWVEPNDALPEGFPFPDVLIVSGWSIPVFNKLADKVRKAGGRVICMNDSNLVFSVKEMLRALRFRLFLRSMFDGFFVPGKSGRRLMRFYGVPDSLIAEGMYSADASLFTNGLPLVERPKRVVYVGQLCARKNVLAMCRAFQSSGIAEEGWCLDLYGVGPQKEQLIANYGASTNNIAIHDFVQPDQLASIYQSARAFVLASKEEHWGLVVHEAALSGCYLLLSNRVGAAEDLLGGKNGLIFSPSRETEIRAAFHHLSAMAESDWSAANNESLRLAATISLTRFVGGVERLIGDDQ